MRAELTISGMTCDSCARTVDRKLRSVRGVNDVRVSLKDSSASVEYDPAVSSPSDLAAAVENLGYTAQAK